MNRAIVTGAGGFIGGHLVRYLKRKGYYVRGVDIKFPDFAPTDADEFLIRDLRYPLPALDAVEGGYDELYALAADMGGMGYIGENAATIMRNNTRINMNTIEAALAGKIQRYLFTSSACVYPEFLQLSPDVEALTEDDAIPAAPDTAYGWEKLYIERVVETVGQDYPIQTRIARFHNVYGPYGTWQGGREKAPAALCRKVAEAMRHRAYYAGSDGTYPDPDWRANIEVWGDGEQTRSFLYIDDCLEGLYRLMHSQYTGPVNIGSDRMVSINELIDIIGAAAGVTVDKRHDLTRPQGVRGRNSDNTLSRAVLDWGPQITLEYGIARTYDWIAQQVQEAHSGDTENAEESSVVAREAGAGETLSGG
jgi:GDP-D-mannose 3',5'-epimerase